MIKLSDRINIELYQVSQKQTERKPPQEHEKKVQNTTTVSQPESVDILEFRLDEMAPSFCRVDAAIIAFT